MLRIARVLAVLIPLTLLAACGNKGELVKPPAAIAPATTAQI